MHKLGIGILLLFGINWAAAQATTAGSSASNLQYERVGVSDVHNLPRAGVNARLVHSHPVLPEDPVILQGEKLRAQSGTTGFPAAAVSETTYPNFSVTYPATTSGFLTFADAGEEPPDTQVAAGLNAGILNLVEMVNSTVRIFSADGTTLQTVDLCSFFQCDFFTVLISDPIVRYDASSKRWFASVVTWEFTGLTYQGQWRLAVSNSGDPTATWTVYAATMTNGTFPDFPKLAISSDKVVQTGDAFNILTNQFKGTEFIVASKADLLAGAGTIGTEYFPPPQGLFAPAAAELLPSPSVPSTIYLTAVGSSKRGSSLRVWQLTGVPNSSGAGVSVTTQNYSVAPFKTPPNAPQLGSTTLIDTNGSFLVDAYYQNGHLWAAANSGCVPAGDTTTRSCLRFVELAPASSTLVQDVTFAEIGKYFYYPAIRSDSSGNLIAIFNRSSSSEYVGLWASGQPTTSVAFQTPLPVKSGEATFAPSTDPRWGDYSGASSDPIPASNDVWLAGEYAQSTGAADNWATWIASAHF